MKRPTPKKEKRNFQTPRVVFNPRVSEGLQSGFDQLVDLIRPTLGPLPHITACEKVGSRSGLPELLDSGGTIARRVIQIPDRQEDVGLMFLRHALWQLQEREGDGTATAAVLFQAIFQGGRRYITAGGDAMLLRTHLERGMRLILSELERQTQPLQGKKKLAGLAGTICFDEELANRLGEIFDIIGPYGRLEVRKGNGYELVREYVEGMYWDSGMRSREMANSEHGLRANLENAAILISDLEIETADQLLPLLQLAYKNGIKQVLLISSTLSERAMGILLTKPNREKVEVVAVKVPGVTIDVQRDALEDLAILCGGRALVKATLSKLENVRLEDLGRARRIWAESGFFGITGGRGDARQLRQHLATLRQAFRSTTDAAERSSLLTRIGKLLGGSATLYVGGATPIAIDERVELAKRTSDAMRGAIREGVVPGGGVALLGCRDTLLASRKEAQDEDERAAYTILIKALEAPFRAILDNAGIWPGKVLADLEQCNPGYGFDVLSGQVVDMRAAGLVDAASVVKGAVHTAVASAALALTTEAIVHHRNPEETYNT
jgi:chaperonin GroEL